MFGPSVAVFTPRTEPQVRRQMQQSVYLDQLAECLYETAVLCGPWHETPAPWDLLPPSERARYRAEAERAITRLTEERQS
jgi:hypothetical protein